MSDLQWPFRPFHKSDIQEQGFQQAIKEMEQYAELCAPCARRLDGIKALPSAVVIPSKIVDELLDDLDNRRAFGLDVDDDVLVEWRQAWIIIVSKYLQITALELRVKELTEALEAIKLELQVIEPDEKDLHITPWEAEWDICGIVDEALAKPVPAESLIGAVVSAAIALEGPQFCPQEAEDWQQKINDLHYAVIALLASREE